MSPSDRSRLYWWSFALVLLVTVVAVLSWFVGALVLGLFVYYATRPIHTRIAKVSRSRSLAAGVALVLIALPVIALVVYTAAVAFGELRTVTGGEVVAFQGVLQPYLDLPALAGGSRGSFAAPLEALRGLDPFGNPQALRDALLAVAGYARAAVFGLVQAFVALVTAFYLLRDDHRLASWFRTAFGGPESTVHAYATAVDRDLQTIYFGNILNAFVVAIVSATSFNALNLVAPTGLAIPAPTLLALLTGVASLIPVVGMKLVYVPVGIYLAGVALTTDGGLLWFPVAFALVALVVVDGLTEVLLRPYISGRDLHVGLVLFAYVIGPVVFGWYGLFLGPLLLVLVVHLARIVLPELVRGEAPTPGAIGTDPIPDGERPDPPASAGEGPPDESERTTGSEGTSEPNGHEGDPPTPAERRGTATARSADEGSATDDADGEVTDGEG